MIHAGRPSKRRRPALREVLGEYVDRRAPDAGVLVDQVRREVRDRRLVHGEDGGDPR